VESLPQQSGSRDPRKSLRGLRKGFDISAEDIDQARREMWGTFQAGEIE
jgi:hypothetical protein